MYTGRGPGPAGTALGTGSKRELTLFSCHEAASETEREQGSGIKNEKGTGIEDCMTALILA